MPKRTGFESRMQYIESLCEKLDGNLDLSEMMKLYEEAISEIAECRKILMKAIL